MTERDRKEIMPGVMLTCIKTDKLKAGCMSVTLLAELKKESAAMGAMLPSVLRRGTARLPDMESISAVLDELYGAKIEPTVRKRGEAQCIGFTAGFVDDAYIPGGEKTLERIVSLLSELLLSPATSGGRLRAAYVESEKKNLADRIKAIKNNKIQYAMLRATELMCAGERYGVSVLGTIQEAESVTVGKLTKYYRKVISESPIEIFYCGAADPGRVESAVTEAFRALPRAQAAEIPAAEIILAPKGDVRSHTETMDVGQGNLVLGFRVGEEMKNPNYPALMIFNAVYGGTVTSKLFENVREKLSLCYFASSQLDYLKGVMTAVSGVDPANYEPARAEMLHQLKLCARGEITPEELEAAKRAAATALKSVSDSSFELEGFYLSQVMRGMICSPEELAELVSGVSAAEVAKIAAGVKLDTVYFLRGPETEKEDEDAEQGV
ncbi:MAG: insulinase family protein [Oscillospiraceae bacterium]|nr:insulinase family protein [Oscillospiraceae bacterium]